MFNMSSIAADNFAKASRHVPKNFSAQVFIDLVAQLSNAGTKKCHMDLNPVLKEAKRIPRDGAVGNDGTSHNCRIFHAQNPVQC